MDIDVSKIVEVGKTMVTDLKGDIDTLKGYFENRQMLDTDDDKASNVASTIQTKTDPWTAITGMVNNARQAANDINNIKVE